MPVPPRNHNGPLRILILDKICERGTLFFGKVESGTIKVGDFLIVMPTGISC